MPPPNPIDAALNDPHCRRRLLQGIAVLVSRPRPQTPAERDGLAHEILGALVERALPRVAEFDPGRASVLSWLMGFARLIWLERRRLSAREQQRCRGQTALGQSAWEALLRRLCVPAADTEVDNRLDVSRLLQSLSAEDRELIQLRYFEDLDYDDLAERLGIKPGAVRVRLCRALQRLREQWEEGEGGA